MIKVEIILVPVTESGAEKQDAVILIGSKPMLDGGQQVKLMIIHLLMEFSI